MKKTILDILQKHSDTIKPEGYTFPVHVILKSEWEALAAELAEATKQPIVTEAFNHKKPGKLIQRHIIGTPENEIGKAIAKALDGKIVMPFPQPEPKHQKGGVEWTDLTKGCPFDEDLNPDPNYDSGPNGIPGPAKVYLDRNGLELQDGDIIDIGQTVNGQSWFYVETVNPLEIYYEYDQTRKYEYDKESLLAPCKYTGLTEYLIIGRQ